MADKFQLSCESTVDLPYSYVTGRGISVLFYSYMVDGVEHEDNMGRDPEAMKQFYQDMAEGKNLSTSQINVYKYAQYFDELLRKSDVLHIALGSGMSTSVNNAREAAESLKEKYPERRIIVVDSLASSVGYGLMIDTVADMRDNGAGMEEIEDWVIQNRNRLHSEFFSTDLTQFKRSGRVSGPYAAIGTALNIYPRMHLNSEGRIIAYDIARGEKKAIKKMADTIMKHIEDGEHYSGKIFLSDSNCPELAEELRAALIPYLGDTIAYAPVYDIGTIIAVHTGPGTVCAYFWGDERDD